MADSGVPDNQSEADMYIPENFTMVQPGVAERKNPGDAQSDELEQHYESKAIQILHSDRTHYRRLRRYVAGLLPELLYYYSDATSVGGGIPKFETTLLHASQVTVIDGFAETYQGYEKKFREIYGIGEKVRIDYRKQQFDRPFEASCSPTGCVTFIHFLEHCSHWQTVCDWIACQRNDVVIYNPNIAAARNAEWVHFQPSDHNVLYTIDAMMDVGRQCGYPYIQAMPYCDDLLVWMRRTIRAGLTPDWSRGTIRERILCQLFEQRRLIRELQRLAAVVGEQWEHDPAAGMTTIEQQLMPLSEKWIVYCEQLTLGPWSTAAVKTMADTNRRNYESLKDASKRLAGMATDPRSIQALRDGWSAWSASQHTLADGIRDMLVLSELPELDGAGQ